MTTAERARALLADTLHIVGAHDAGEDVDGCRDTPVITGALRAIEAALNERGGEAAVERAAAALANVGSVDPDPTRRWKWLAEGDRVKFRLMARAALLAALGGSNGEGTASA